MLNGDPGLLSMGWRPETGFIKSRWDIYSEHLMLQLLAIGSPTHPIPPRAWLAWERTRVSYAGYTYLSGVPPLFIHQYSHAWVDFRGRREAAPPHNDYFANSVTATRVNRQFCIDLALHFGLGSAAHIDKLEIKWPDGAVEMVEVSAVDKKLTVIEGKGIAK